MALATFAAGCFWGVEVTFRNVPGVRDVTVGYTGGVQDSPTYHEVCTGRTGHAEAVLVDYDAERVSYAELLRTFLDCHDPTTVNRQGPDIGTQYRSAIFYHDEEQAAAALKALQEAESSRRFSSPIVTEVVPAGQFFPAEEYHQRYLEKRGLGNCHR